MGRDGVARSLILDRIWLFIGHGGEGAQRLECALAVCKDLAGAFAARPKSGSKLRALHTLRANFFPVAVRSVLGVASSPRWLLKSVSLPIVGYGSEGAKRLECARLAGAFGLATCRRNGKEKRGKKGSPIR